MHILKVENVFLWAGSARKMSSMQCIQGVTINLMDRPYVYVAPSFSVVPIKLTDSQEPVGTRGTITDINCSQSSTIRGHAGSKTYLPLFVHTSYKCLYDV